MRTTVKIVRIVIGLWAQALIDTAILNAVHGAARALRGSK